MHHRRNTIAIAAALLVACSTTQDTKHADGPKSLSRSFAVLETRRGSEETKEPRSTLVDYESEILVQPDRDALVRALGARSESDTELRSEKVAELDARIDSLRRNLEVVRKLTPIVEEIADYERDAGAFYADIEEGVEIQALPGWKNLNEQRRSVIDALDTLTRIYVSESRFDGAIDWDYDPGDVPEEAILEDPMLQMLEKANPEHDRLYATMAPPLDGEPARYDAVEVTRVLNRTTKLVRDRIAELEEAILAKAPKAELEMEASIVRDDKRLPITIAPYTIVQGVDRGKKAPRVGLPSREDIERVREEYEAYDELADALNDLAEIAGDSERLDELRDGLKKALRSAAEALADGLESDLDAILEETDEGLADVRDTARTLRSEIRSLVERARALRDQDDLEALLDGARALVDELRGDGVKAALAAFVEALEGVPETLSEGARALVDRAQLRATTEWRSLVEALAGDRATAPLAELFSSLQALADLANARSFGDIEAGKITRRPFSIATARDGQIQLASTPAKSGDQIEISYRLVDDPKAKPEDRVEYVGATYLDVRKFGYYPTLKSQLLFYDRLHDGLSSFRAAPGLSYNLHYRPEDGQAFHDVVAPGLGISVSSPSFDDGAEIAVGLQLTLFNDMLQLGYAYNISVDEDQEMFYFGLDLIGAYQRAQ